MRKIAGLWLVWWCLLGWCDEGLGQGTNAPLIAPPADWVAVLSALPERQAETNQLQEGVRYVLVDDQVNVARQEHYTRVVKDFVNENGVQEGARLTFVFDPSYQQLTIHRIAIQRGSNTLEQLKPDRIKVIQQESDLERHLYDGTLSALIFLEDVRVGDRLDFSYTRRGFNPVMEGKYAGSFTSEWGAAIDRLRFRLVWPGGRNLGITNHSDTVQPTVTATGNGAEYVWEKRDLKATAWEDMVPAWCDRGGWVQLSEYGSWAEVAVWAAGLYPRPGDLPPELAERLAGWQRTIHEPEELVRTALGFVQDEIRYLGFEVGPGSHRPTAPGAVFTRRFGDCKDKSYLLCTILQRLGFDACPVLVHSGYRSSIGGWLPSPRAFNHVIVRVQAGPAVYWVDPTRSFQRGPLSQRYLPDYGCGLVVRPDTTGLAPIPWRGDKLRKTTVREVFRVAGRKEPARLTVETVAEGADADRLRALFADTHHDELQKRYLNHYARRYPKIAASGQLRVQDDPEQDTMRVTEHYTIQEFWTRAADSSDYECDFYPQGIDDRLDWPETTLRSMPLRIDYPRHDILRTEVTLPEPWPDDKDSESIRGPAAVLTRNRSLKRNRLVMEYEYRATTNLVAAGDVPRHIKTLDQMEKALGYTLSWPEDAVAGGHMNWSLLILGGLYVILLWIGATFIYRRQPPPLAPEPEPDVLERRLIGLGGWLFLVGLSLVVNPFVVGRDILELLPAYSLENWNAVTSPASSAYHPLHAPLLIIELLCSLTLLAYSVLLAVFFFQRRRRFPILYILFLLSVAFVMTADELAAQKLPAAASRTVTLPYSMYGSCLIWIPYMLRSRRVKATFVR